MKTAGSKVPLVLILVPLAMKDFHVADSQVPYPLVLILVPLAEKDFHVVDYGPVFRGDDRFCLDDVIFPPNNFVRQPMDRAPVSRVCCRNFHRRISDLEGSDIVRQFGFDISL